MGHPDRLFLHDGMQIARHHHERRDSAGDPDDPAGTRIPPSARLMSVADVHDALNSRSPCKEAMSHDAARDPIPLPQEAA
jgi:putative two-component system response regulator